MSKLLTMLTAKSPSFEIGGGGGDITPELVAAACNRMKDRRLYLYALFYFAGDKSVIPALQSECRKAMVLEARFNKWVITPKEHQGMVESLADSVLNEFLSQARCWKCLGAGVNREQRNCRICGGSGFDIKPTEQSRADSVGVTIDAWNRRWKIRFYDALAEYETWTYRITGTIRRALKDG